MNEAPFIAFIITTEPKYRHFSRFFNRATRFSSFHEHLFNFADFVGFMSKYALIS